MVYVYATSALVLGIYLNYGVSGILLAYGVNVGLDVKILECYVRKDNWGEEFEEGSIEIFE